MKKTIGAILACSLVAIAAVAGAADPAKSAAKPAAKPAAPASSGFSSGKGKVLETMDAGGYTYVKVDLGGAPIWAAAPQFKVKKGQNVVVPEGSPMPNFHSKTLNRTFDVVYFVGGVQVEGGGKK